jgi:hypothetical protein
VDFLALGKTIARLTSTTLTPALSQWEREPVFLSLRESLGEGLMDFLQKSWRDFDLDRALITATDSGAAT